MVGFGDLVGVEIAPVSKKWLLINKHASLTLYYLYIFFTLHNLDILQSTSQKYRKKCFINT